jgi:hypothetical protein
MSGQLGSASEIEYFCNRRDPSRPPGYVILAPYSGARCPTGYTVEHADTLSAVDRLQFTLLSQEKRQWEKEQVHEESLMADRQRGIVSRLHQIMCSGATTPYERDFIEAYLKLAEDKRLKHRANYEHRVAYLSVLARECPPDRLPNEEKVNLDRMELPEMPRE